MSDKPLIYTAIDTDDLDRALELCRALVPEGSGIKIGMEFFNTFGPGGVQAIKKECPQASFFIDLKFHDIPNTVAKAVKTISENLKPDFLNVHASGGLEMMKAARKACAPETKLLAVTILTSMDEEERKRVGYTYSIPDQVKHLAALAREAGLDGVVCSAHEIEMLRAECGYDFILMVPGIRLETDQTQDQKRVMTPGQAVSKGATHLVIGRPITQADSPIKALNAIHTELDA